MGIAEDLIAEKNPLGAVQKRILLQISKEMEILRKLGLLAAFTAFMCINLSTSSILVYNNVSSALLCSKILCMRHGPGENENLNSSERAVIFAELFDTVIRYASLDSSHGTDIQVSYCFPDVALAPTDSPHCIPCTPLSNLICHSFV